MSGVLLIHGGWHGPWCWDDFGHRLTERGHEVRAVQLRGHDRTPGRIWHRVHHYLDDVERAAAEFAEPPVLVGHSLGGLLAQMYLERNPAPGAVLMASIPPGGMIRPAARFAARHPLAFLKGNLLLSLRPLVGTTALVREMFFSPDTPQDVVDNCEAHLQDESYPAFVDVLFFTLPRPRRVRATPMLVMGTDRDGFFTIDEIRRTASAYGTEAEIYRGMGHNMMLDPGWQEVADRVDAWVQETDQTRSEGNGN